MKGVIVVRLSPEMRAAIEQASERSRTSAQMMIDALRAFRPKAADLERMNNALVKAGEQIRKAGQTLKAPARHIEQKQRQVSQGRRRFPIPRNQKVR